MDTERTKTFWLNFRNSRRRMKGKTLKEVREHIAFVRMWPFSPAIMLANAIAMQHDAR